MNTIKPVAETVLGSTACLCPCLQRLILLGVMRLQDDNQGDSGLSPPPEVRAGQ